MTRTHRRLFAALALVTAMLVGSTPSLAAQNLGSVELVAQSAWVDDGGIFNAQVRVAGAAPDSTVSVRVLEPWESRTEFASGDTSEAEPLLSLDPIVLADAQETSNEVLPLEIRLSRAGTTTNANSLPVLPTTGESAVFPLEIALVSAEGDVLDSLVTSIIHIPRFGRGIPLTTAMVLEADPGATIDTEGQSTLTAEELAEIEILIDAVAQHRSGRVSLAITAETLLSLDRSDLEGAQEVLDRISDEVSGDQLLPQPLTKLEEQAWIDAEFANALAELYQRNAEITEQLTGSTPDNAVAVLDQTLTAEGLRELRRLGIDGAVVEPTHLETLDSETFPEPLTTRFLIPVPGIEPVPAMAFDVDLSTHFLSAAPVPVAANRFLAELTLLSIQNPNVAEGVVIRPPGGWEPNSSFLNIVLSGIERIPMLAGATLEEALAETAFTPSNGLNTLSPPLRLDLDPRITPNDLRSYRTEFNQAQTTIDAWATVIASDQASVERLNELLELSTSSDHNDSQRSAFIEQIYNIIDTQKDGSITTPPVETITLTGRSSDVPVLIDNNLGIEAQVILVLDSEKLDFPEGREVAAVLTPGSNRIEIPIETRGSGDSPIRIQIFSPDRSVLLGSSEVVVRAFAVSGVGVVIGVLAILVLLVWWLRHHGKDGDTVDTDVPTRPDSQDSGELIGV